MSSITPHLRELEDALEQLETSSNAQKLFIESYLLGKSSIGRLAKAAGMDRSSAYLAASQLIKRGLVEEETSGTRKEIRAISPAALTDLLKKKSATYAQEAKRIEKIMPELLQIHGANNSNVRLRSFFGRETLYRITEDILNTGVKVLRIITNQNAEQRVFSAQAHDEFIQERVRRGIKALVLAADTPEAKLLKRYDKQELRETHTRSDLKPFQNETYIYGEKVAVLSYEKDVFGFIVQAKEFAELQAYMFDRLWKLNK